MNVPPGNPGAALSALRQATAQRHEAIEAMLQLSSSHAAMDLPRYAAVLRGFERFLAHWEPKVLAALPGPLHGWFRSRSRYAWLLQDLQVLATRLAKAEMVAPILDPTVALQLPDRAAAFGSIYVIEGSALGGQVIARALEREHGLAADQGLRYFTGHGADTGRLWREFRDCLGNELDAEPAATARACTAAVATFDALIACFRATPGAIAH
jgi:heme oxygenase